MIEFATHPDRYRHWRLELRPPVATLVMDVEETGGLAPGYELKLNSYDLGVDIELADAVQRLRFEHPDIRAVVLTSAKDKVFCAGANIRMLASSTHHHKVNFCKFTNETRNAIEDATAHSGQTWIAALNGAASGGGYELALACDRILLVDDGASAVAFPELPLLAVLPGTGGLTRVVDKRHVRRDLADVFATKAEGVYGRQALEWGLVDEVVPRSRFEEIVRERALEIATAHDRRAGERGIEWPPLTRRVAADSMSYPHVDARFDRELRAAFVTIAAPGSDEPHDAATIQAAGAGWWPLAVARALDDLVLHLRFNEPEIGSVVWRSEGDLAAVAAVDDALLTLADHWLVRETQLYWRRTLKRFDVTSRSLFALVEPGSCFTGMLAELVLGADRSYMLDGTVEGDDRPAPELLLTDANFGPYPMPNGLSRLESRCFGRDDALGKIGQRRGERLDAGEAEELGLVTFAPDDIDWDDEIRIALEERAGFSPDALTGMEANHRFVGPETPESKIFARLSAWQNWIFQRPNAAGPEGALRRYGTGTRPVYDHERV
ncbi:MAG TPA: 2,3-epoxybenzoyl-CoA dihydrolase [Acidimicrobiia bacterium]